jgi:hypothetical protein
MSTLASEPASGGHVPETTTWNVLIGLVVAGVVVAVLVAISFLRR